MGRPKKKIVLFLVEGNTDINVLAGPMQSLFEKNSPVDEPYIVEFCTYHENNKQGGDVTSSIGVTPDNIEGIISKNFVEPFMVRNSHYYIKDVCKVIQITDVDGVFIPDAKILQVEKEEKEVIYTKSGIVTNSRENIIERNERKRNNLIRLVNMDKIAISKNGGKNTKSVDYAIFYFSCNMDHCLHGDANLTTKEKVRLSDDFMRNYDTDDLFYDYISSQPICCENMNYKQSWDYIMKEESASLERRTNLNVLIESIKNN